MTMKIETLRALVASIEHWKKDGPTGERMNSNNCPLCTTFFRRDKHCHACPVYEKTRLVGCAGTPYEAKPSPQEVEDEIEFLESLLPVHWELMLAHAEGAQIQHRTSLSRGWWINSPDSGPKWQPFNDYRVKPPVVDKFAELKKAHDTMDEMFVKIEKIMGMIRR